MKKPRVNWQTRIPGHKLALCEAAKRAGLSVSLEREAEDENGCIATWTGTEAQFRNSGIFPPSVRMPVRGMSYASVPYLYGAWIEPAPEGFLCRFWWTLAQSVGNAAPGVIHYDYDDVDMYYGSPDALIAAGIITAQHLPRPLADRRNVTKASRTRDKTLSRRWSTEVQPDGRVRYWIEKEAAMRERAKKETDEGERRHAEAQQRKQEASQACEAAPDLRRDGESVGTHDYVSTEAMLGDFASLVHEACTNFRKHFSRIRTRQGYLYRLAPEAIERTKILFDDLYHEIKDLDVSVIRLDTRTEAERQRASELAAHAERDGEFKRFMGEVLQSSAGGKS